jgi:hypothetical protein
LTVQMQVNEVGMFHKLRREGKGMRRED